MGVDSETKTVHPTIAGLLMFGYEYEIVREFSQYFLDYQEQMDSTIRWTHRVISSSGEWSGNLFDFYFRIINRLTSDLPVPFKLVNNERNDDTPLHETVREALLNALVHADYYGRMGTVVIKSPETLSFANPGDMRISLAMAMEGGFSDPRNATLMKMFGLIGVGERAGSGIPSIIATWENETHHRPLYKISYSPERVMCTIFVADSGDKAVKSGDKSGDKVVKSGDKRQMILAYLAQHSDSRNAEIATELGLSVSQTRDYMNGLVAAGLVVKSGANRNRTYKLKA